jgi:hypothetical protein
VLLGSTTAQNSDIRHDNQVWRAEQADEEEQELQKIQQRVSKDIMRLAARFSKSENYFCERLIFAAKSDRQTRSKTNAFNAFIRDLAQKENASKYLDIIHPYYH